MPHRPWNPDDAAAVIAAEARREGALLPVLHALTSAFGYVPSAAVPLIADALNLSRAEVHGVISFYHDFRTAPPPAHVLKLCRAEACQARGGEALATATAAKLTGRADISLEAVYCLGLCASGPAALLDDRLIGRLDAARLDAALAEAGA